MSYSDMSRSKAVIAMELIKKGWEIFGFHEDQSDSMTDYYAPAWWSGIATKNGFIVNFDAIVDMYSGKVDYTQSKVSLNDGLSERDRRVIAYMKSITKENATLEEYESAQERIAVIQKKAKSANKETAKVCFPVFQENPGKCKWHVEKDGVIIAKGTGVTKFEELYAVNRQDVEKDLKDFTEDHWRYQRAAKMKELFESLDKLVAKVDVAAGGMIGNSDYDFITRQEIKYKHENVAVEVEAKQIFDGATFVCKAYLGYNRNPGYVYRIHARGNGNFTATRMNKALTEDRTGNSRGIEFGWNTEETLIDYIDKGYIKMCEIQDKATPYTVEKTVKVKRAC